MSKIINDDLTVVIAPASYAAAESNAVASDEEIASAVNGLNLASNTNNYAPFTFIYNYNYHRLYVYYTFNTRFIPAEAEIIDVSAVVRAHTISSDVELTLGYFNKEYGESNRSYIPMSDKLTVNTDSELLTITTNNGWDIDKLSRINLRFYKLGSATLHFYGCSLTIHYIYNGIIYYVTGENTTSLIGDILPNGLSEVYPESQSSVFDFTMIGNSINGIIVEDEKIDTETGVGTITDVTSLVQQRLSVSGLETMVKTPSDAVLTGAAWRCDGTGTDSTDWILTDIYKGAIGKSSDDSASNTKYFLFRRSALSFDSYVDYKFDFSDILFTAKIINVSVSVNARTYDLEDYRHICSVRLFSGEIPKSETIEFEPNKNKRNITKTFSYTGEWTVQELLDAYARFTFGVSGGYINGISWAVDYIIEPDYPYYWVYTLPNIILDHNITVRDVYEGNRYMVETVVYYKSKVDVSNTYRVLREGELYNVTIYTDDIEHCVIYDNNINMTGSLSVLSANAHAYIYTINNIDKNHTIKIVEALHFSIIATSLVQDVTVDISKSKAYVNDSFTITVNAPSISSIVILDNGTAITNNFVNQNENIYTYTITNVNEDHEIIVNENTKLVITALSNSENILISPNGYSSVYTGELIVLTIDTALQTINFNGTIINKLMGPKKIVAKDNLILKDNNIDVSDQIVLIEENVYTYMINSISESHTVIVYEMFVPNYEDPNINYYSLTITSLNAETIPNSQTTTRIEEGVSTEITIVPKKPLIITCTDNGDDITDEFQKIYDEGAYIQAEPTYTVPDTTETYKFILNNNTGYYTSNNSNIPNSLAVSRINFVLPVKCIVKIGFINYSQTGLDYGIFGNIDIPLLGGTSAISDSDAFILCNTSEYNKPQELTIEYTILEGEHFIDIKYLKNADTKHINNDNLQWRIIQIEPLIPYVYYTYTVLDINKDHSLVFVFGDNAYYTIESSGTNSRLYPNGTIVKSADENYNLTIIPDVDLYKITLIDNGLDKTADINKIESIINNLNVINYIYTINRISDNHVIEIECRNPYYFFLKKNNLWGTISKVYKKINDEWVIIYDYNEILDNPHTVRIFKENIDNGR